MPEEPENPQRTQAEQPESLSGPDEPSGAVRADETRAEARSHAPEPPAAGPPIAGAPQVVPFSPPDPAALKLALLSGLVISALVGTGILTATFIVLFTRDLPPAGNSLALAWAATAITVVGVLSIVLPALRYRRYSYRVDARGLEIRKGLWWRSHRLIPRSRLQHTDVAQGPIERYLGLGRLVAHTAGTHEASTTLSGITIERAKALRDDLTADSTEDGADGV